VNLKNNVKRLWWEEMTQRRDDVEGLDAAILMHPMVWKASGHVDSFTDPMVDCKTCKQRFRADEIKKEGQCPACGNKTLSDIRQFNLMFKTFMGPVEEDAGVVYLRPETCQGIYVNFENVRTTSRQKIPFGIAQIGKSFRNEISPGNFIFRSREFEQMEMQYFVHPSEADKWFEYWKEKRMAWYLELGIRKEKLRFRDHASDELAHYARRAVDIEYEFPFGWKELEGIHNRGNYDLSRHKEFSGKDLSYFDDATKERFIPYIIETSGGIDRALLAFLSDAYDEEFKDKKLDRVVMHFHPKLAPIKLAVLPLVNRDGMDTKAQELEHSLRKHFPTFYDDGGTIGRRYRRQDEAGTPFGATVDSQTLQDDTVTLRDRDTMEQIRVPMKDLAEAVDKKMEGWERRVPGVKGSRVPGE